MKKCDDCLIGLCPIPYENFELVYFSDILSCFYHIKEVTFFNFCPYCGSKININNEIISIDGGNKNVIK